MASDFLKNAAMRQAAKIDAKFGANAYGGTKSTLAPEMDLNPTSQTAQTVEKPVSPVVESPKQEETKKETGYIKPVIKQIETPGLAETKTTSQNEGSTGISIGADKLNAIAKDSEGDFILANDDKDIINTATVTGRQVATGALKTIENTAKFVPSVAAGVANAVGDTEAAEKYTKAANDIALFGDSVQEFMHDTDKYQTELGETGQFVSGLGRAAGEMLPSILAGNILGSAMGAAGAGTGAIQAASQASSLGTMFARVYGGEFDTMTKAGYDIDTATKKALSSAIIETGTEMLTGGIPGVKNSTGILDKGYSNLVESMLSKTTIPYGMLGTGKAGVAFAQATAGVWNFLNTRAGDAVADLVGEGVEEWISELVTPWVDRGFVGLDTADSTHKERAMAFLGGALLSVFLDAGQVVNAVNLDSVESNIRNSSIQLNNDGTFSTMRLNPTTGNMEQVGIYNLEDIYNITAQEVKADGESSMADAFKSASGKDINSLMDDVFKAREVEATKAETKAETKTETKSPSKLKTLLNNVIDKISKSSDSAKAKYVAAAMEANANVDVNSLNAEQKAIYSKVIAMNLGVTVGFSENILKAIGYDASQVSDITTQIPMEFWPEQLLTYHAGMTQAEVDNYYQNSVRPALNSFINAAGKGKTSNVYTQKQTTANLKKTASEVQLPLDFAVQRNWFTDAVVKAYKAKNKKLTKTEVKQALVDDAMKYAATNPTIEEWNAYLRGKLDIGKAMGELIKNGQAEKLFGKDFVASFGKAQTSDVLAAKYSGMPFVYVAAEDGSTNRFSVYDIVEKQTGKPWAEASEADFAAAALIVNDFVEKSNAALLETLGTFDAQLNKYGLSAAIMTLEEINADPERPAFIDHDNKIIKYNPNKVRSKAAAMVSTAHELTHAAQRAGQEVALSSAIKKIMASMGYDYDAEYEKVKKTYKDKDAEIWRMETDAKFLGTVLATQNGMDAFASADPSTLEGIVDFIAQAVDPTATDPISQSQRKAAADMADSIDGVREDKVEYKAQQKDDAKVYEDGVQPHTTDEYVPARLPDGTYIPEYSNAVDLATASNPALSPYSMRYDFANNRLTFFEKNPGAIGTLTRKLLRPLKLLGVDAKKAVGKIAGTNNNIYELNINDPIKAKTVFYELCREVGVDPTTLGMDIEGNAKIRQQYQKDYNAYSGDELYDAEANSEDRQFTDASTGKPLGATFAEAVYNKYGKLVYDMYLKAHEHDVKVGAPVSVYDTLNEVLLKTMREALPKSSYYTRTVPQLVQSTTYPELSGLEMKYNYANSKLTVSGSITQEQYRTLKALGFKSSSKVKYDNQGSMLLDAVGEPIKESYPNRFTLSKNAEQIWAEFGGTDLFGPDIAKEEKIYGGEKAPKPTILSPKARRAEAVGRMVLQNIKDGITELSYPGFPGISVVRTFNALSGKGKILPMGMEVVSTSDEGQRLLSSSDSPVVKQLRTAGWQKRVVNGESVFYQDWDVDVWNALKSGNTEAFKGSLKLRGQAKKILESLKTYAYNIRGNGAFSLAYYNGNIVLIVDNARIEELKKQGLWNNQEFHNLSFDGQVELGGKTQGGFKSSSALFPGVKSVYSQPYSPEVWRELGGPELTEAQLQAANGQEETLEEIFKTIRKENVFVELPPFSTDSYRGRATVKDGKVILPDGSEAPSGTRVTYRVGNKSGAVLTRPYMQTPQVSLDELTDTAEIKRRESLDKIDKATAKKQKSKVEVQPVFNDDILVVGVKGSERTIIINAADTDVWMNNPTTEFIIDPKDKAVLYTSETDGTRKADEQTNANEFNFGGRSITVKFKGSDEEYQFGESVLPTYAYVGKDDSELKPDPSIEWIKYTDAPEGEYIINTPLGIFNLTKETVSPQETSEEPKAPRKRRGKKSAEASDVFFEEETTGEKSEAKTANAAKKMPLMAIHCQQCEDLDAYKLRYNPTTDNVEVVVLKNSPQLSQEALQFLMVRNFMDYDDEATGAVVYYAKRKAGLMQQFGQEDMIQKKKDLQKQNRLREARGELVKVYDEQTGKMVLDEDGNPVYKSSGGRVSIVNFKDTTEKGVENYRADNPKETKKLSDNQVIATMLGRQSGMQVRLNGATDLDLANTIDVIRAGIEDTTKTQTRFKKAYNLIKDMDASFEEITKDEARDLMFRYLKGYEVESTALAKEKALTPTETNRPLEQIRQADISTTISDSNGRLITGDVAALLKTSEGGQNAEGKVLVFTSNDANGKPEPKMTVWGTGFALDTTPVTVPGVDSEWYVVSTNPLFVNGMQATKIATDTKTEAKRVVKTLTETARRAGVLGASQPLVDNKFVMSILNGNKVVVGDIIQEAAKALATDKVSAPELATQFAMALGYDSVRVRKPKFSQRTVSPKLDAKNGVYAEDSIANTANINDAASNLASQDYTVTKKNYIDGIIVFDKSNLISATNPSTTPGGGIDSYAFSEEDIRKAWEAARSAYEKAELSKLPITGWLANIPEGKNELINKLSPKYLEPAGSANWTGEQWGDYWEELTDRGIIPRCTEAVWFNADGWSLNEFRNDIDRNSWQPLYGIFDDDFSIDEELYDRVLDRYTSPDMLAENELDTQIYDIMGDMEDLEDLFGIPVSYQESSYVANNAPFQPPVQLNANWQKIAKRAHPIWKDSYGRLKLLAHGTDAAGFNAMRRQPNGSFSTTDWLYAQAYYGYDFENSTDSAFKYASAAPEYIPVSDKDFATQKPRNGWYKIALPTSKPMIVDAQKSFWFNIPTASNKAPEITVPVNAEEYENAIKDLVDIADDMYNITDIDAREVTYHDISKIASEYNRDIYSVTFDVKLDPNRNAQEQTLTSAMEAFTSLDTAIEYLSELPDLDDYANAARVQDIFYIRGVDGVVNGLYALTEDGIIDDNDIAESHVFKVEGNVGHFSINIAVAKDLQGRKREGISAYVDLPSILNFVAFPGMLDKLSNTNENFAYRIREKAPITDTGQLVKLSKELGYDGSVYAFDIGSSADGDERTHTEAIGDPAQYKSLYADNPHPGKSDNLMDYQLSSDALDASWEKAREAVEQGPIPAAPTSNQKSERTPLKASSETAMSKTLSKMMRQNKPSAEWIKVARELVNSEGFGLHEIVHDKTVLAAAEKWHDAFNGNLVNEFTAWKASLNDAEMWKIQGQGKTLKLYNALVDAFNQATKDGEQQKAQDFFNASAEVISHYMSVNEEASRTTRGARYMQLMQDTPQGAVYFANQWLEKKKRELINRKGVRKSVINQFKIEGALMEQIASDDPETRDKGLENLAKTVAMWTPSDTMQKLDTVRNINMLLNTTTHLSNWSSNIINAFNVLAKGFNNGWMEDLIIGDKGERNFSLKNSVKATASQEVKADWEPLNAMADDIANSDTAKAYYEANGNKYFNGKVSDAKKVSNELDKIYLENTHAFNDNFWLGKAINKAAEANYGLLENEDFSGVGGMVGLGWTKITFGGWQYHFKYALKQKLRSNDYTTSMFEITKSTDPKVQASKEYKDATIKLNKCIEFAVKEADDAVYHTASGLAKALNKLKADSPIGNIIFNAIDAYTKSPINVAKTAIRYSPLAWVGALNQAVDRVKMGEDSQYTINSTIDRLSSGLHGTVSSAMGFILAMLGVLIYAPDDDDDKDYTSYLQNIRGKAKYAVALPGGTYSISWISPNGMMVLSGAAAYKQWKKLQDSGDVNLSAAQWFNLLYNTSTSLFESFMDMSFVSGFSEFGTSLSYNQDNQAKGWTDAISKNYTTQLLGSSLIGKIENIYDPISRSTYAPTNSQFVGERNGEQTMRSIAAKHLVEPLVNAPNYDEWGNVIYTGAGKNENVLDVLGNAAYQLFSPGKWYPDNSTERDAFLDEIYAEVKDKDVYPAKPSKSFTVDHVDYVYDNAEYAVASSVAGETKASAIDDLMQNDVFSGLDEADQFKVIDKVYTYADNLAKDSYLTTKGISYKLNDKGAADSDIKKMVDKVQAAIDAGLTVGEYYMYKQLISDYSGDGKTKKQKNYLTAAGLTAAQVNAILN